ncbi:hypothetical protein ACN9JG_02390 [Cereibacter azotoformans]|uniref:Uncharacterized protein n=2 Tax=Cereibacter azotoformans TaxID=43057 RepID=A0A2T5JXP8_9RHOB|nr:hypothetical protein D0Z66_02215 [Cereibacter sphaeroides]MBO4169656.1 hypothetical protein [Cereibacter azotoformans]PTR14932.1 hypothetical protein C8J28_11576 [Cereibacter azotoformans]
MVMDLLATLAAGAGLAGIALLLRRLSGQRLPKWIVPAGAGAGMLLFSVWNEYSWYPRVTAALPSEVVVISAPQDRVGIRPWTFLFPVATRFMALDRTGMLRSETDPAIRRAEVVVVQRWHNTQRVPMAFDCTRRRTANLETTSELRPDGTLTGTSWLSVPDDDELLTAACREG